eukprot:jgi/Tetstr1/449096/TSEL_036308.t1
MAAPAPLISERNLGAVPRYEGVPPLGGTAATVARYIAWQGLRGTVKADSLQPYLSAINGFYRDHGAEPVAQGDLISKGAATAAYAISVLLQKIKHFGGWAQLSSVVLDYINPTALPCAASWQLFCWLTPWDLDVADHTQVKPYDGEKEGKVDSWKLWHWARSALETWVGKKQRQMKRPVAGGGGGD